MWVPPPGNSHNHALGCALAMQLYCQYLSFLLFFVSPGEGCQIYCSDKSKDAEITDGAVHRHRKLSWWWMIKVWRKTQQGDRGRLFKAWGTLWFEWLPDLAKCASSCQYESTYRRREGCVSDLAMVTVCRAHIHCKGMCNNETSGLAWNRQTGLWCHPDSVWE